MAKGKKTKSQKRERKERRFVPASAGNPLLVKVMGGLGAASLGAGTWAQFGHQLSNVEMPPVPYAPYILAAGAAFFAAAIWLGTSSEPALRVGSAGIAIEKVEIQRIPWYAIERVVWDRERAEIAVRGKDDAGKDVSLTVRAKNHGLAAAWIAREAKERIPKVTDVPDEVPGLPQTRSGDGELLPLDPVQVVGCHCAASGQVIAYEPDARVCPKCERVYHKSSVPEECACGAKLSEAKPADAEPGEAKLAEAKPADAEATEPAPTPAPSKAD